MTQSLQIAFLTLFISLLLYTFIKADCVFNSSTADLKGKDTVLRRTTKSTGDLLDTITSQF